MCIRDRLTHVCVLAQAWQTRGETDDEQGRSIGSGGSLNFPDGLEGARIATVLPGQALFLPA
eukprot:367465-Prymnesium_polylepis.1